MKTRKQRQDELDNLIKESKTLVPTSKPLPPYQCPNCRERYYGIESVINCTTRHDKEEKEMRENREHAQKIELLDRALEYSKVNQISLAEAQKEINDFLNPPTCQWTLHLDNEQYPCSLPKDHKGHHESGKMLKFDMKFEEQ